MAKLERTTKATLNLNDCYNFFNNFPDSYLKGLLTELLGDDLNGELDSIKLDRDREEIVFTFEDEKDFWLD